MCAGGHYCRSQLVLQRSGEKESTPYGVLRNIISACPTMYLTLCTKLLTPYNTSLTPLNAEAPSFLTSPIGKTGVLCCTSACIRHRANRASLYTAIDIHRGSLFALHSVSVCSACRVVPEKWPDRALSYRQSPREPAQAQFMSLLPRLVLSCPQALPSFCLSFCFLISLFGCPSLSLPSSTSLLLSFCPPSRLYS